MRQASFRCLTCRTIISNTSLGTKHRNHCPLCLWSKHLDLQTPGDRRSLCKGRMEPVGITLKNIKYNPFTDRTCGELMIVHICLGCGHISCNRIAGDDNSYAITSLLEKSTNLNQMVIKRLANQVIKLLTQDDKQVVLASLYGHGYLENFEKVT